VLYSCRYPSTCDILYAPNSSSIGTLPYADPRWGAPHTLVSWDLGQGGAAGRNLPILSWDKQEAILQYLQTDGQTYKPVGDWISAPSPNFVAVATWVGPTTFCIVSLNWPFPKTPWQAQTSPVYLPYKPTGRFAILCKFWGVNFGR